MLTKFLDFDKIYNFCFNEKIVTPKNLPLQAFVIATLENSFGRSTLVYIFLSWGHFVLLQFCLRVFPRNRQEDFLKSESVSVRYYIKQVLEYSSISKKFVTNNQNFSQPFDGFVLTHAYETLDKVGCLEMPISALSLVTWLEGT